jgi:hypothetical protein
MTAPDDTQSLWDQVVGEHLSGIVFVRDYLQLQFNSPPQINAYSKRIVVSSDGGSAKFGEETFANLAVGLIGRFVREVRVDAMQSFRIIFRDGAEIMVSLGPENYEGPEAVDFQGRNGQWAVI